MYTDAGTLLCLQLYVMTLAPALEKSWSGPKMELYVVSLFDQANKSALSPLSMDLE